MPHSLLQKLLDRARLIAPLLLLMLMIVPTLAQSNAVETQAADGITLKGDFYLVDLQRPTVLLLHQLYTTRASWQDGIGVLTGAGFNVLAVDVRGSGETGGKINWPMAVQDVGTWMAWLRNSAGVRGDAISTMGSSMGSTLAILGCANDGACRTAIALSPGWSYSGISIEPALTGLMVNRPFLVVYGKRDRWPALGVPRMTKAAPDLVVTSVLAGNKHGMDLLAQNHDAIWATVLDWLANHGG
jgi:pimeloyl-ACP methyl ester carboxylesterase